ncbi:hypothetical protein JZ751_016194 [Albula glossodonta]|uniref:B-cell receptor CD22 n=1 Tax=Albula glossodonta TaxID=121402 RepID=A0A8T2N0Z6_9TELE|nr:hypothetical protein JZ751_016194 [Albula glossodonta]
MLINAMLSEISSVIVAAFLSVPGIVGQKDWSVTYTPQRICALKGSTVDIPCTYSYPRGYSVKKTLWFIYWPANSEPKDLSQNPQYRGRVEYRGNKKHDCSFRIKDLTERDSATYRFRFLTHYKRSYAGQPGVTLTVTDLQVSGYPDTVTEGQSVTLTCRTTCALSDSPAFIWYKNNQRLSFTSQELQITASIGDYYSCAVGGYESHAVTLNVECLRAETDSDTVTEGQSVTLTCRTTCAHLRDSRTFRWYKNGADLHETGSILQFRASSERAGTYSCDLWDGSYGYGKNLLCSAVTLSVRYAPKLISVSVSPSGEIKEGSSVTLTCSSDANPPVQTYTWFKKTGAVLSERGTGESYTITDLKLSDSGEYYCKVWNSVGGNQSLPKPLSVQYPPKSTSASVGTSNIQEGSSVTLTCSSDAKPPVQRYTWFKKNESGVWQTGSGQSLNFSNFRSWNSGLYYCETQNTHGAHNSTALLVSKQDVFFSDFFLGGPESAVHAAVGTTAFMALLLTAVILWMRRRKSTKSQNTEADRQDNKSPVYDDISGTALSHTAAQDTNRDNDEAAFYSAVQPVTIRNQEGGLYSTVQPVTIRNQEGGLYSTVQPVTIRNQEEGLYSTVQPTKINSYHYGDTLYSNGQEPHPQAEVEVQYASIRFTCASAAPR